VHLNSDPAVPEFTEYAPTIGDLDRKKVVPMAEAWGCCRRQRQGQIIESISIPIGDCVATIYELIDSAQLL